MDIRCNLKSSKHVVSCHVMSRHVMPSPVMSCHVTSHHAMSCHVTTSHMSSRHITLRHMACYVNDENNFVKKTIHLDFCHHTLTMSEYTAFFFCVFMLICPPTPVSIYKIQKNLSSKMRSCGQLT